MNNINPNPSSCFTQVKLILDYMRDGKREAESKQEWSEEDETCLEYALWCVMKTRHFVAKDACDLDACRCAERWLKSLCPQPNPEWSKEEKK